MSTGSLVGAGRTAHVFEYGQGRVVKVLRPGIPAAWATMEASFTAAVHARGMPTPAVLDLVEVDGRAGVVFERIDGPSMWNEMLRSSGRAHHLAIDLAALHREVQAELAPAQLPSLIDRVAEKLDDADALTTDERWDAHRSLGALEQSTGLCHGDLHPGNVIMSATGPVLIDWYDAAAGSPIADVVRTSLLIRPSADGTTTPVHLPGATPALLHRVHQHYLEAVMVDRSVPPIVVRGWERVLAAGRLAEGAEPDESHLVALWRGCHDDEASVLLQQLSLGGAVGG